MADVGEVDPLIGTLVADRYRITRKLGEGGMGVVYLAVHEALRKQVAMKLLATSGRIDREAVARFEREAIAAANLKHPNIAEATDFGRLPDGALYLVMEYVEGTTLRKVLREQGKLAPERALAILQQVAAALATAHASEVVHRDLKPENVIVRSVAGATGAAADHVKVIDFGIAKIRNATFGGGATGLTKAGTVFGTPEYMAPEQVMGQVADARADQYALGVLAFELLTGKAPFKSDDVGQLMMMHVGAPVPSTRDRVPSLAPEVDAVVTRMLAKMPDERFRSVGEAMAAMAAAFAGKAPPSLAAAPSAEPLSHPTVKLGRGQAQDPIGSMRDLAQSLARDLQPPSHHPLSMQRGTLPSATALSIGPATPAGGTVSIGAIAQAVTPSSGTVSLGAIAQAATPPGGTGSLGAVALQVGAAPVAQGAYAPGSLPPLGAAASQPSLPSIAAMPSQASLPSIAGAPSQASLPSIAGAPSQASLPPLGAVPSQGSLPPLGATGSSGPHGVPSVTGAPTRAKAAPRRPPVIAIGIGFASLLVGVLLVVLVTKSCGGPPTLSAEMTAALADFRSGKLDPSTSVIRSALTADPKLAESDAVAQALAAQVGNETARRALAGLLETTALGRSTAMASALATMAVKDEPTARNGALELVRDRQDLLTAEQGARVRLRDAEECDDFEAAKNEEAKVATTSTLRDLERLTLGECKRMVRVTEVCECKGGGGKGGPPGLGSGSPGGPGGPGKGKGKKDKGKKND